MTIEVSHDSGSHQFVANSNGHSATLKYHIVDRRIWDYYSTFVPPSLRGKGVGQALAKFALNYAKDNQLKIKPTCSFVKAYIDAHPEYKNLLG